jgi:hypothetical protein
VQIYNPLDPYLTNIACHSQSGIVCAIRAVSTTGQESTVRMPRAAVGRTALNEKDRESDITLLAFAEKRTATVSFRRIG